MAYDSSTTSRSHSAAGGMESCASLGETEEGGDKEDGDGNSLTVLVMSNDFCPRKQVTVADAYTTGQKVMGRANLRLGKLLPGLPEDLHFLAFFGVSAQVSVTAWDMMENHSVLPPTPKFLHFLWALAFMRTYPANDTTLSSLLRGCNPKTMSKYMWSFIQSIYVLNEWLVS